MSLRARYAMPGTDRACAATRTRGAGGKVASRPSARYSLSRYAFAMLCPVLTCDIVLRRCYVIPGTDVGMLLPG
eukprot:2837660-Rhodomonas_salina.2